MAPLPALRVVAVAAAFGVALLWPVGFGLKDLVPPPLDYDTYNRLLTPVLVLLILGQLGVTRTLRPRLTRAGRVGLALVLLGFFVMLAGNALEFWGVLLQDAPNANDAYATGETAWWGSQAGWGVFGVGMLLSTIGGAVAALDAHRAKALGPVRAAALAVASSGLLAFVAIPTAVAFGAAWAATGVWLARPEPTALADGAAPA